MAKKFSHAVGGRTFRTANGKKTHVNCTPIAKNTPAPAAKQNAPAQVSAEKQLIAELTAEIMRTETKANGDPIGYVRAIKRATKAVKS